MYRPIVILFLFYQYALLAHGNSLSHVIYNDAYPVTQDIPAVTAEDFDAVALSGDTDYDALVLYRTHHNFYTPVGVPFQNMTEVFERILIVGDNALSYATESVSLYRNGKDMEDIIHIKARTYNLVNGEVVTTEMGEDAIFLEEPDENWRTKSFTLPAVTKGSIIEFSYLKTSPYPMIDDVNIQYNVPINHINIQVDLSRSVIYTVMFNPEALYKIGFSDELKKLYASNIKDFDVDNLLEQKNEILNNSEVLVVKNENISYVNTGVPALKDEPFVSDVDKYRAKIMFEVAAYQESDGSYKNTSTDWNTVARSLMKSKKFGGQLNSSSYFKQDLKDLKLDGLQPMDKAKKVLEFFKANVKWNGDYGIYIKEGVKDAYKKGSGNISEINLLLTNMFREVEIEAYPVLVSSSNNKIPLFPTTTGFNYVISMIKIEGKQYLVDGSARYGKLGVLPSRAAHWKGRVIIDKQESMWIDLEEEELSNDMTMIMAELDKTNDIKFSTKKRLTDLAAFQRRNTYADATKNEIKEYIENKETGLNVEDFDLQNLEDVYKPLNINFNGTYTNGVDEIGDKLYVTPLLYDASDENYFKAEDRKLPVKLPFPIKGKTVVNLTIPEGYEVETVPESIKAVYNEGEGSYTFLCKQHGNIINTVATYEMNTSKVEPQDYAAFRDFFINIVDKDAEKIVLRKKPE